MDLLNNDYKRILPIIFNYERDTPKSNAISTDLKRFYFGEGPVENTTQTREGIEGIYADGLTGFAVNRATKLISDKNQENTYYYCFTYRGRYSYFYLPNSNNETVGKLFLFYFILVDNRMILVSLILGAVHHDDLQYIFYVSTLFPYIHKGDPEWSTVDKMVKIWSDFAYTGYQN